MVVKERIRHALKPEDVRQRKQLHHILFAIGLLLVLYAALVIVRWELASKGIEVIFVAAAEHFLFGGAE